MTTTTMMITMMLNATMQATMMTIVRCYQKKQVDVANRKSNDNTTMSLKEIDRHCRKQTSSNMTTIETMMAGILQRRKRRQCSLKECFASGM